MLKIYGSRRSGNSNKVEYTALLLDVKYEFHAIDIQKDSKTEWYMKIHPAGKVPSMVDGDFTLFESVAMCRYLCNKTGNTGLYPGDIKQRALIDQWIDFIMQHVGTAMGKIAGARYYGPMFGKPVDETAAKEGEDLLARFLPILEVQLGKHAFIVSDEITLADIVLLGSLESAANYNVEFSMYKHLDAWIHKMKGNDFFKKVHTEKQ